MGHRIYLASYQIVALWIMDIGIIRIKGVKRNVCHCHDGITGVSGNLCICLVTVIASYTQAQRLWFLVSANVTS